MFTLRKLYFYIVAFLFEQKTKQKQNEKTHSFMAIDLYDIDNSVNSIIK